MTTKQSIQWWQVGIVLFIVAFIVATCGDRNADAQGYVPPTTTQVGATGATGATGAAGAAGANGADGKNACDVDVCASGCDYTSIGTATSTEAEGTTICVKDGDYTEANTVTVKADQRLVFGTVQITMADTKVFYANGDNISMAGHLTITGNGGDSPANASVTILARFAGANHSTAGLYLAIVPTWSATGENTQALQASSTDSHFGPIYVAAQTNDSGGAGTSGIIVGGADNYFSAVTIKAITDSSGSGTPTSNGFGLYNADRTHAAVNVGAVTTATGNNGVGVFINSDVTNSTMDGVTLGSDGATFTNSGGATNKNSDLSTS